MVYKGTFTHSGFLTTEGTMGATATMGPPSTTFGATTSGTVDLQEMSVSACKQVYTYNGFLMLLLEMAAPSTEFDAALDVVDSDSARNKIISSVIMPYISSRLVCERHCKAVSLTHRHQRTYYHLARQSGHKSVRSRQPQERCSAMKKE